MGLHDAMDGRTHLWVLCELLSAGPDLPIGRLGPWGPELEGSRNFFERCTVKNGLQTQSVEAAIWAKKFVQEIAFPVILLPGFLKFFPRLRWETVHFYKIVKKFAAFMFCSTVVIIQLR